MDELHTTEIHSLRHENEMQRSRRGLQTRQQLLSIDGVKTNLLEAKIAGPIDTNYV